MNQLPKIFSYLIAVLAGASMVLAFSPFEYPWLALPGLVILYSLFYSADNSRTGFFIGWFWGIGLLAVGVFWLRNSIAQFGGLNLSLAIALTLLFSILLALFYAFAGWLLVRFTAGRKQVMWLVFPIIWMASEWVRGRFLGGFPWLTLGYSQIDTPLAGLGPVGGVYLISFVLLLSAALLFHWKKNLAWLGLASIWGSSFFLLQAQWVDSAGQPFLASLVQGNIKQQLKWRASQLLPTIKHYDNLSFSLPDSKLIVWPETAIPTFSDHIDKSVLQPLHQRYKENGQDLLVGIPVKEDDGRYYNAMLSFGYSGQDKYFKKHLVPFGEFMPLKSVLAPLARKFDIPMSSFSSGDSDKYQIKLAGFPAGISICYEDVFGDEIAAALPQASFLINASNDGWFGDSLAPHQHLQMARMRALETGRYLLRVTNTGISAVIDEKGKMRVVGPQFKEVVLTYEVQPLKGVTPYVKLLNYF